MRSKSIYSATIYLFFCTILFIWNCNCEEFYYTDDCDSIDGQFGQCVPINSCPLFLNFLKRRPIRKTNLRKLVQFTCKFDNEDPKVCCPIQDITNNRLSTRSKFISNDKTNVESLNYDVNSNPRIEIHASRPYILIKNRIRLQRDNNGYVYRPPLENPITFSDRISRRHQGPVLISSRSLDISNEGFIPHLQRNSQEDSDPVVTDKNLKSHPKFKLIPNLQECSNSFKLDRLSGTFGTYPWLALIGNKDAKTNKFEHICTGSVINSRYIITAAHCVKDTNPQVIRLGEYNLDTELDFGLENLPPLKATDYEIETFVIHNEYSKLTQENDIALIRVAKDIDFSTPYVKPVCLPFAKEYDIEKQLLENDINKLSGKLGWIVGWGRNTFGLILKDRILEESTVPIISSGECSAKYRSLAKPINSKTQFCAGGRRRRTPCVSDRGGPLLFATKIPSAQSGIAGPKFFQLGINLEDSKKCEETGFSLPTVYTKVSSFLEWILNSIK